MKKDFTVCQVRFFSSDGTKSDRYTYKVLNGLKVDKGDWVFVPGKSDQPKVAKVVSLKQVELSKDYRTKYLLGVIHKPSLEREEGEAEQDE